MIGEPIATDRNRIFAGKDELQYCYICPVCNGYRFNNRIETTEQITDNYNISSSIINICDYCHGIGVIRHEFTKTVKNKDNSFYNIRVKYFKSYYKNKRGYYDRF